MKKLFVFCLIVLIIAFVIYLFLSKDSKDITEEGIIEKCRELNVAQTSKCLKNQISLFYKYKDSPDYYLIAESNGISIYEEKTKNFSELQEGGDCNDYSELYKKLGTKLGFPSYTLTLENKEVGHKIAILYHKNSKDKTRYCILDLLKVKCFL